MAMSVHMQGLAEDAYLDISVFYYPSEAYPKFGI
jgi:hypothetical protein